MITGPHAGEPLLPLVASHVKRADHKPSHWRTSVASGRIARQTGMITGPHGGEPLFYRPLSLLAITIALRVDLLDEQLYRHIVNGSTESVPSDVASCSDV